MGCIPVLAAFFITPIRVPCIHNFFKLLLQQHHVQQRRHLLLLLAFRLGGNRRQRGWSEGFHATHHQQRRSHREKNGCGGNNFRMEQHGLGFGSLVLVVLVLQ